MTNDKSTPHAPNSKLLRLSALAFATTLGLSPTLGCDKKADDGKKADGKKADGKKADGKKADGKKADGKEAKGETPAAGDKEAKGEAPAAEGGETELAQVEGGGGGVADAHLWLHWNGTIWQYNDTDPSVTTPPTSWSAFADPANPRLTKAYGGATAMRVFVHNDTGSNAAVTFEQTGSLNGSESHKLVLSDEFGSWDDWHVRMGDDPVFHIKKGSTGPGAPACKDIVVRYLGDTGSPPEPSWEFGNLGGRMSPVTGPITCFYEGESAGEFEVTVENGSSAANSFTVSEKRPIGTVPYADNPPFPWNDIAWQIGEDPGFGAANNWKIQADGSQTVVELLLTSS
ncbi:MAG: hypothetical protein AAF799_29760 [Myxococcota bacterium]